MKQTNNPNTLTNLTKLLNGNRGIAERFLNSVSDYVDTAVENGALEDIDDDELEDFFWDVVADEYKESDEIYDLVTALGALNHQYSNRISDSYGYLARLMVEYYRSEYGKINESKTNKNMKQNAVKLNEKQLKKIVAESVRRVLKEYDADGIEDAQWERERMSQAWDGFPEDLDYASEDFEGTPDDILKRFAGNRADDEPWCWDIGLSNMAENPKYSKHIVPFGEYILNRGGLSNEAEERGIENVKTSFNYARNYVKQIMSRYNR